MKGGQVVMLSAGLLTRGARPAQDTSGVSRYRLVAAFPHDAHGNDRLWQFDQVQLQGQPESHSGLGAGWLALMKGNRLAPNHSAWPSLKLWLCPSGTPFTPFLP